MRRGTPHVIASLSLCALILLEPGPAPEAQPAGQQARRAFQALPRSPLANEHKDLDAPRGCPQCHVGATIKTDDDKCLGCHEHKDLRERIEAGEGLHGTPWVTSRGCADCHLEHKGRAFNVLGWKTVRGGPEALDHGRTGWALGDGHDLECKRCHTTRNRSGRRTFLGLSGECSSCHDDGRSATRFELSAPRCVECHASD